MTFKLVPLKPTRSSDGVVLKDPVTILGRGRGCPVCILDALVSRRHCKLILAGDRLTVRDLGSANGTYVNRTRVHEVELKDGDVLVVGRHELAVQVEGGPVPDEIEPQTQPAADTPTASQGPELKAEPEPLPGAADVDALLAALGEGGVDGQDPAVAQAGPAREEMTPEEQAALLTTLGQIAAGEEAPADPAVVPAGDVAAPAAPAGPLDQLLEADEQSIYEEPPGEEGEDLDRQIATIAAELQQVQKEIDQELRELAGEPGADGFERPALDEHPGRPDEPAEAEEQAETAAPAEEAEPEPPDERAAADLYEELPEGRPTLRPIFEEDEAREDAALTGARGIGGGPPGGRADATAAENPALAPSHGLARREGEVATVDVLGELAGDSSPPVSAAAPTEDTEAAPEEGSACVDLLSQVADQRLAEPLEPLATADEPVPEDAVDLADEPPVDVLSEVAPGPRLTADLEEPPAPGAPEEEEPPAVTEAVQEPPAEPAQVEPEPEAAEVGPEAEEVEAAEEEPEPVEVEAAEVEPEEAEAAEEEPEAVEVEAAEVEPGPVEAETAEVEPETVEVEAAEVETGAEEGEAAGIEAEPEEGEAAEVEPEPEEAETAEEEPEPEEAEAVEVEPEPEEVEAAEAESEPVKAEPAEEEAEPVQAEAVEVETETEEAETAETEPETEEAETAETEPEAEEAEAAEEEPEAVEVEAPEQEPEAVKAEAPEAEPEPVVAETPEAEPEPVVAEAADLESEPAEIEAEAGEPVPVPTDLLEEIESSGELSIAPVPPAEAEPEPPTEAAEAAEPPEPRTEDAEAAEPPEPATEDAATPPADAEHLGPAAALAQLVARHRTATDDSPPPAEQAPPAEAAPEPVEALTEVGAPDATPAEAAQETEAPPAVSLPIEPCTSTHPADDVGSPVERPLHEGARDGERGIVSLFLSKGADVNAAAGPHGATPLHYAAGNGHVLVVEFLLAKGAHPNALDDLGATPLYWARLLGHDEVTKSLLAHGADPRAIEGVEPL